MLLVLLIIIPIILGAFTFTTKKEGVAPNVGLFSAIISLILAGVMACNYQSNTTVSYISDWMPALGAKFSLLASGTAVLMVLLTAIVFVFIFISQRNKKIEEAHRFYALIYCCFISFGSWH
jgi:NADH:ubiquinone oxidoreductase subunit 4 (subunit M)